MTRKLLPLLFVAAGIAIAVVLYSSGIIGSQRSQSDPEEKRAGKSPESIEVRAAYLLSDADPKSEETKVQLKSLGQEWALRDLDAALEFREKFEGRGLKRQSFDEGIMPFIATERPEYVIAEIERGVWWKDKWKPEQQALMRLAATKPEWVASAITTEGTKLTQWNNVVELVGTKLTKLDAAKGRAFADSLQDPVKVGWAMRGSFRELGSGESARQASEELVKMEEGSIKDYAISGFAMGLSSEDPEAACVWIAAIKDEKLRTSTWESCSNQWRSSEGAAVVREVVTGLKISNDEKRLVQRLLDQPN